MVAMIERFARLPRALEAQARYERLGAPEVPALLAHPDWSSPAPVMIWMHGRTVDKTLDPGRYLRWMRAGIATCALDLPGHGERSDESMHGPDKTLYVVEQMLGEIDHVVEALAAPRFEGVFDLERMGVGGMSAGGIAALRRLADEHPFVCAAVESTIPDFSAMPYLDRFGQELVERLDPMRRIKSWRAIPLLALHTESDEWAPVEGVKRFVAALRARYEQIGADPDLVRLKTWERTGAPAEHAGFGKFGAEAKEAQVEFLKEALAL